MTAATSERMAAAREPYGTEAAIARGARRGAASAARRARTRAEQKRLTFLNLALLLGLGVAVTALVLRGTLPLPQGLPAPATFAVETAAYVLLFDAYFYVLHRLLHTRWAFRHVHAVHHRAREVDLWSTIAMHPIEFVAIVGFVPLALCLWPVHVASLLAVCTFLGASIAFAHSGFLFRPATDRALLGVRYLTPRIHASHHASRSCNYGAITTLLDRAAGTLRA
jgi:sterol desaturase/sphingolipid hydroxylase (fatty acid hydroxylase superfamily)